MEGTGYRAHRWLPLLALMLLALPLPALQAPGVATTEPAAPTRSALTVRFLANEGFLVEGGGRRVLVDALFGDGIAGYTAVPAALRGELESGTGEWSDIDLVLVSHHHGDHFDPDAVARFLSASEETIVVAPPQTARRLEQRLNDADSLARVRAVLPPAGEVERLEIDGIVVEALNLHHGRRRPPVENLGFVVHLGERRFLHFGDTEAQMEDFAPYLDRLERTDLALLPFWFLTSEWRAGLVRQRIRPRWIVVAHVPRPDAPAGHFARWRSYENLVRVMRSAFPQAHLPTEPGQRYRFATEPSKSAQ